LCAIVSQSVTFVQQAPWLMRKLYVLCLLLHASFASQERSSQHNGPTTLVLVAPMYDMCAVERCVREGGCCGAQAPLAVSSVHASFAQLCQKQNMLHACTGVAPELICGDLPHNCDSQENLVHGKHWSLQ
jgi:hypothetical protein